MHENVYFEISILKYVCFDFLDTFVIEYRLYGSNPQGWEVIEALTVCSRRFLTVLLC